MRQSTYGETRNLEAACFINSLKALKAINAIKRYFWLLMRLKLIYPYSLHLVQMLEKELVPACLKLYFNPTDVGAKSYLKTLRQLWRQELDMMESFILGMVDPCAFCIIVEAEARRIAGKVKKDQYSQDCDLLR